LRRLAAVALDGLHRALAVPRSATRVNRPAPDNASLP
jgi:hypothetical protein